MTSTLINLEALAACETSQHLIEFISNEFGTECCEDYFNACSSRECHDIIERYTNIKNEKLLIVMVAAAVAAIEAQRFTIQ